MRITRKLTALALATSLVVGGALATPATSLARKPDRSAKAAECKSKSDWADFWWGMYQQDGDKIYAGLYNLLNDEANRCYRDLDRGHYGATHYPGSSDGSEGGPTL